MQPSSQKTALAFHAKDDLPEVRREVFKILPNLGAKVLVAIRHKETLLTEAKTLFEYRRLKLRSDDVYDSLIKSLFRDLLHRADENRIVFAHRGKTNRREALENAIRKAKKDFATKWKRPHDKPTETRSGYPSEHAGLQVVDYYLWALQRMFERREDRFFNLLREGFRVIRDLDDKRVKPHGAWYSDRNPLTLEKIK